MQSSMQSSTTDHYEGAVEIDRAWREGLTPDPLLSVSEWSDRHRMLSSKASAEPGRWRTSRTPYLKDRSEPAEVVTVSDDERRFIVYPFVK